MCVRTGDCKGHETPSYLLLEAQRTIGGGVSAVTAPTLSAAAGGAGGVAAASANALFLMTDSGSVLCVRFKAQASEKDVALNGLASLSLQPPAPVALSSAPAALLATPARDEKASVAASASKASASKGAAATPSAAAAAAAASSAAASSYSSDSKQAESNIELLRTALHLFVHNQTTNAMAALRSFEQNLAVAAAASASGAVAADGSANLDECVVAVSTRVIDALPFTGKARLENAVAATGLPLHDGRLLLAPDSL